MESVDFGPQPANDYWPTFAQWGDYPPSKFYLGFFAAVTVEADDVTIDLNGYTLQQSKEFYLLQRFFNVIELNDRPFIANTGVSSLNFQKTDNFIPEQGNQAGSIVQPKNVVIRDGTLGRSSHNGIHGNGVENLKITNVHVRDFEVAGIQCNGCQTVEVRDTEVGPASSQVPALATFSNARFLQFFTKTLIPHGFAREPQSLGLMSLFESEIFFADRSGQGITLRGVFDRVDTAVELFKEYYRSGYTVPETWNEEEQLFFAEVYKIFNNKRKTTDGSVQYGLFFGRLGMPGKDDVFNGAGKEARDIKIRNVKLHDLSANPVEVPSLVTEEGAHMQGPARDLIRIADITSDEVRTVLGSSYQGNFLSDAYFALWKMSNDFYRMRVFDSSCGNFGSNASFPYLLTGYPGAGEPTCTDQGTNIDELLSGRDVTMLQKRYFGGLQVSQGLYDWATIPGSKLDSILSTPARPDLKRNGGRHRIVCDHDTMFHENQGVVGIKLVEALQVEIKDVTIERLTNTADEQPWICGAKWQLQPSGEDIYSHTNALSPDEGSRIRGIWSIRSEKVELTDINIEDLVSHEGASIGLQIDGDGNDRTDHEDDDGVSIKKVQVKRIFGPGKNAPFISENAPIQSTGLSYSEVEEVDSSLRNPRVILNYRIERPDWPATEPLFNIANPSIVEKMFTTTKYDTVDKIKSFQAKALAYYASQVGASFAPGWEALPPTVPVVVLDKDGNPTDTLVLLIEYQPALQYHATSLCVAEGNGEEQRCSEKGIYPLHDFAYILLVGSTGYTFHGAFGGDSGKLAAPGDFVLVGVYVFEGIYLQGVNEGQNIEVEYFGECPIATTSTGPIDTLYINCALESTLFGKGRSTGGTAIANDAIAGTQNITIAATMIFDDQVLNPVPSAITTSLLDGSNIPVTRFELKFVADGVLPARLSTMEAVPFGNGYFFTHEAALEFFHRRTSLQDEHSIRQLRQRFLERLRDEFGIDRIDPTDYEEIPLDGEIDLGGGNQIVAYVVNEASKLRVIHKMDETTTVTPLSSGARLYEGGFMLRVGRSGILGDVGRLPFGTILKEGLYVFEDDSSSSENYPMEEFPFHSIVPIQLDQWSTSVVYERVLSEKYGSGLVIGCNPLLMEDHEDGIPLNYRGSIVFSLFGSSPTPAASSAEEGSEIFV